MDKKYGRIQTLNDSDRYWTPDVALRLFGDLLCGSII